MIFKKLKITKTKNLGHILFIAKILLNTLMKKNLKIQIYLINLVPIVKIWLLCKMGLKKEISKDS